MIFKLCTKCGKSMWKLVSSEISSQLIEEGDYCPGCEKDYHPVLQQELYAAKEANNFLAIDLARSKEETEYQKAALIRQCNVAKSVWADHEKQFAQVQDENEKLRKENDGLKLIIKKLDAPTTEQLRKIGINTEDDSHG